MTDIGRRLTAAIPSELGRAMWQLREYDWMFVTGAVFFALLGALFARWLAAGEAPAATLSREDGGVTSVAAAAPLATAAAAQHNGGAAPMYRAALSSSSMATTTRGPRAEATAATRKFDDELKMVLALRRDLKPSESLAAAWGATAAAEAVQHVRAAAQEPALSWLRAWNKTAVAKVALRVDGAEAMAAVVAAAVGRGLPVVGLVGAPAAPKSSQPAAGARSLGDIVLSVSAGSQLVADAQTMSVFCLAIGPAPLDMFDGVTDALKLY